MTDANWKEILADPAVLSAVRAAASSCMRDACNHGHYNDDGELTEAAEYCDCTANRMTPIEFHDWLELETKGRRSAIRRQPAGQPNRRRLFDPRVNLALAG